MKRANVDALPGLKRLLGVIEAHGLTAELHPSVSSAPRSGDLVAGKPFDPVLARLYAYCDGGRFNDFVLLGTSPSTGDLVARNERRRRHSELHNQEFFYFARVWSQPYHMATVPSLADAEGPQPVVWLTTDDDYTFEPIASNADRAIGLYARLIDKFIRERGLRKLTTGDEFLDEVLAGPASVGFPYDFLDLIAKDKKLVRLMEEGRFDPLVSTQRDSREWVEKVLAAAKVQGKKNG